MKGKNRSDGAYGADASGAMLRQGEFDDGLFGRFAEEETDGGVFIGELHLAVVVVHMHLHLAEVYLTALVDFLAGAFCFIAGNATEGGAVKKEADGMMTGP